MTLQAKRPHFGEIWLAKREYEVPISLTSAITKTVQDTRYVLTLSRSEDYEEAYLRSVHVAPISFDVEFATDLDLILPAKDNPLKVECMAEFWNIVPTLECNLERYEGKLSNKEMLRGAKGLWKLAFGLADDSTDFTGILTGSIIKTVLLRVTRFQEQEIKETAFLQEPALAALGLLEEKESKQEFLSRRIDVEVVVLNWLKQHLQRRYPRLSTATGATEPSIADLDLLKERVNGRIASLPELDIDVDWVFEGNSAFVVVGGGGRTRATRVSIVLRDSSGSVSNESVLQEISAPSDIMGKIFMVQADNLKMMVTRETTLTMVIGKIRVTIPLSTMTLPPLKTEFEKQ